jgi:predicted nucleic acid-binding protein
MRYVLNSSVAVKWAIPEIDSDKAAGLRDAFRNAVHELLAPDIFPAEVASARARAERRGILPASQGAARLADVLNTVPLLHPSLPDLLPRAYAIASQGRVWIFDCLYVALDERENCQFVTADDRPVNALQAYFPFVVLLASLP